MYQLSAQSSDPHPRRFRERPPGFFGEPGHGLADDLDIVDQRRDQLPVVVEIIVGSSLCRRQGFPSGVKHVPRPASSSLQTFELRWAEMEAGAEIAERVTPDSLHRKGRQRPMPIGAYQTPKIPVRKVLADGDGCRVAM